MTRKCKTCKQVELPPARQCQDFLSKSGYCSEECQRASVKSVRKPTKPKKKTKRKQMTPAKFANNVVAPRLQLLVRMKAADDNGYCTCVTCGKVGHYKNLQGGHFISRRYSYHKLREENLHPQDAYCNGHLRGNLTNYTLYMIDMYGREFVEWLEATKNQGHKWRRDELEAQLEEIERQIEEQKIRLGEK